MTLLEIKDLVKNFGGLSAISNVNISLDHGELIGLIGPNGAGKTTLFNLITGVYEPTEGSISLEVDGQLQRIDGQSTNDIADLGVARTFQNIRLFSDLTVLDNVLIAMHSKQGANLSTSIMRTPNFYKNEIQLRDQSRKLLTLFNLEEEADNKAKNLAYGQQRRLEIVRALATNPKILFLDEPAAGMNPQETQELTELIQRVKDEFKITIVLIEHDMDLVMKLSERIYVLEYGRLIAQGSPEDIRNDQRVIDAYLGGG